MDLVVGHPRSGTMLVAELLSAGRTTAARHEHLVVVTEGRLVAAASAYYEARRGSGLLAPRLARQIKQMIEHGGPQPADLIDCNWKNTWILPVLFELYPDARVLHLTRDPRRNVVSCHNLDYYGKLASHPAFLANPTLVSWREGMPEIARSDWQALSPFAKNCAFWAETHRLILEASAARPRERCARVRLEDLTSYEAISALHDFFGRPPPRRDAIERIRARRINDKGDQKQLIEALKDDLLPPFEQCPAEIQETLRRLCGPVAGELGYHL